MSLGLPDPPVMVSWLVVLEYLSSVCQYACMLSRLTSWELIATKCCAPQERARALAEPPNLAQASLCANVGREGAGTGLASKVGCTES